MGIGGFLKCNRTKAGYLRWHLVVEGCRPASYSLNVLERYGNLLPAVYPAQERSASLTGIQKSLMLSHEAFP
ncbi:hypothetical protein ACLEZ9_001932, partial [Cronobacter sakazakii]